MNALCTRQTNGLRVRGETLRGGIVKIFILLSLFLFKINLGFTQEFKRGNNWAIGFSPVVVFNFNSSFSVDTFQQIDGLLDGTCISDTNGKLLFFSSGWYVGDRKGLLMENGLNINCPKGTILSDYYGGASLFDQTSIILPKKGNTYYVFSTGMSDSVANNYLNHVKAEFDVLNYSVVDMDSNAGKGKVTVKNKILMDYQHYVSCALTAVKHGNGKDWWLLKADCINNQYQLFLVQEDTIIGPYYRDITAPGDFCNFNSQVYFSEDGTKMASSIYGSTITTSGSSFYNGNRVDMYDFDRCAGIITYKNYYNVLFDTISYPDHDFKHGICFSPNGKLLYMMNRYTIYQIDLEDSNINNSIFITGPDTVNTYFARYSLSACGPDGKLYVGNRNGTRHYMSYIDKPNIKGLGCDLKANGLWQPYTNLLTPPNMPNYGLGKAPVGGNCWPEGNGEVIMVNDELLVYPNPAIDEIMLESESLRNKEYELSIISLFGEKMLEKKGKSLSNKIKIDMGDLPMGIYVLRVNGFVRKIVKE